MIELIYVYGFPISVDVKNSEEARFISEKANSIIHDPDYRGSVSEAVSEAYEELPSERRRVQRVWEEIRFEDINSLIGDYSIYKKVA